MTLRWRRDEAKCPSGVCENFTFASDEVHSSAVIVDATFQAKQDSLVLSKWLEVKKKKKNQEDWYMNKLIWNEREKKEKEKK